jgi:hypothetical protein
MSSKKLQIFKVKDKAESFYTKKDTIFDIPMRLLVVGKSQLSGKSNLLVNLLLRDEYYNKDFKGEDIYIVSPSVDTDDKLKKLVDVKEIPEANLMPDFDEDVIMELYKILEEEYREAVDEGEKPSNKLIVFDDISYKGDLKKKKNGIVAKLFSNGRHINVSCIVTAQKYSDISTSARENCNGAIFFDMSNKQLELVEADVNYTGTKKDFMKMFRDNIGAKHSFIVVNFTNDKANRYLNEFFEPIKEM